MPAHQRLLIVERARQSRDSFRAFQIAKRHRNVAQKAAPLGAQNRTTAKALAKVFFIERQERDQFRRVQAGSWLVRRLRGRPRLDIVRANLLADVTTENMVADKRPQCARHPTLKLDGQIGNAAPRIEHVGPDKCTGGTRLKTKIAPAAAIANRTIIVQRQVEKQFTQKKPRAFFG